MNTLYLTATEQSLYDSLSDALRDGWTTKDESLTFRDTDHRRRIRFEMLKLDDPRMQHFMEKASQTETADALDALIKGTDFTEVSDADFSELMFAIGPDGVTTLLHAALKTAKDDDDVAYAAELSNIRHGLLESLQNFSS
jgi:hypothetical protein